MQGHWYPVSLAHSVEPGSAAGVRLDGRELVVWRDGEGGAHVWEDRCPHRGMRLSLGFVREGRLGCLYHGWEFGADGQCSHIPAHPDSQVPKAIRTRPYPKEVRFGMIWTALSAEPPPPLPEDAAEITPVASLYLDCAAAAALSALRASRLPPFRAGDHDAGTVFETVAPTLFRLSAGSESILVGLQAVAAERTALHIVIEGPGVVYAGQGQSHFLRWAQELRHRIETPSLNSANRPGEAP
ncbi:oxidoreductase [Telmatospirillum siberiense]|uniref:Oxidoreductase n=2 Tax=Telmatospirillum siberiense TaxID=382514 RepID=A0A2N3PZ38_9PROT|nr:oxidoreductase [Telmatospirillum siberiense]